VVFHTYPKLIFAWPLIVAGFLFWLLAVGAAGAAATGAAQPDTGAVTTAAAEAPTDTALTPATAPAAGAAATPAGVSNRLEILGWLYILILLVVLLTLGIDIERNHAVFWLVVFIAFFFLGKWLADAKHFTFFGDIYAWYADLNVQYNRSLGLAISCILLVPYVVMLLWARIQHRWRITHNEFEHYAWGRADDSLARGAKRVRSTYPDLLELLLCGAGTLIVYSATGRTELRRIPHVPMIFLVRRRINRLLEVTAVTASEYELAEVESEQEERGEADGGRDDRVDGGEGAGNEAKEPL
jgi:hypothetical protein